MLIICLSSFSPRSSTIPCHFTSCSPTSRFRQLSALLLNAHLHLLLPLWCHVSTTHDSTTVSSARQFTDLTNCGLFRASTPLQFVNANLVFLSIHLMYKTDGLTDYYIIDRMLRIVAVYKLVYLLLLYF